MKNIKLKIGIGLLLSFLFISISGCTWLACKTGLKWDCFRVSVDGEAKECALVKKF